MATLQIKLTSKRQATFPAETCTALGVGPGDTLEIQSRLINGEQVWVMKQATAPDFSWVGSLKGKSVVTDHSMETIRASIAAGRNRKRL